MRRLEAIGRLWSLEDEFRAAEFALAEALARAEVDPTPAVLQGLSPSDLHRARAGLEATYTIRLFAEFEGAVRSYWRRCAEQSPRCASCWMALRPGGRFRQIFTLRPVRFASIATSSFTDR